MTTAHAHKQPCFTEADLTGRMEKRMKERGIKVLGWKPMQLGSQVCYIAVVEGKKPTYTDGGLYTVICMGGHCTSWNHSSCGVCNRNPDFEKPFASFQALNVFGRFGAMVNIYEHDDCPKDALHIIGDSGEGNHSMPLCVTEDEPIPQLTQIESYEGAPTGYYKLQSERTEGGTTTEEDADADVQSNQTGIEKKRASDVRDPWKGRLRSAIQKKRPVFAINGVC